MLHYRSSSHGRNVRYYDMILMHNGGTVYPNTGKFIENHSIVYR